MLIFTGVAKKITQDSILGNTSSSYALQVFEGTTARIENSKHKIQIKRKAKDLKESSFGVLLDLNNQFLNIYLDGELQTDISRPKGPSFKGLSGEFCAGLCLYGTKVEMSMVTGIATPSAPGTKEILLAHVQKNEAGNFFENTVEVWITDKPKKTKINKTDASVNSVRR